MDGTYLKNNIYGYSGYSGYCGYTGYSGYSAKREAGRVPKSTRESTHHEKTIW
jgi:hypothetical protein